MNKEIYKLVQDIITTNYVTVFSKSYCSYCRYVKDTFNSIKTRYTVVELDLRNDGKGIQDVLGKMTGSTTVPRVFINGKFIGGAQEIDQLYNDGKLESLLKNGKK